MDGYSTQDEWEKEEKYLTQYTGQEKRVRHVYDPEVREYLVKLGMLEDLLTGNYKLIIRPAKFEDRKQVDYEIYQQMRDDNIELRSKNKLTTTDEDIAIFYMNWLNERVEVINYELSKTYPNGKEKPNTGSRQIANTELYKYRTYLESEIKTVRANIEILSNKPPAVTQTQETKNKQELSARQRMLIYCYEMEKPINRGEPNYGDYITFASPTKRKGYPNGSAKRARWLIMSIYKILPYLSDKATQQANSELYTIEANLVTG